MKKLLLLIPFLVSCGSGSGSATKTCQSDDYDCWSSALFFKDDGTSVNPISFPSAFIVPNTNSGSVTLSQADTSKYLSIETTAFGYIIDFNWTDANGARPAFCLRPCPKSVMCTSTFRCTASIKDGLKSGTWRSTIGYSALSAGAAGTTADGQLEVIPISASGGAPVLEMLNTIATGEQNKPAPTTIDGKTIAIGEPTRITQKIISLADLTGGNTGTGGDGSGSGGGTAGSSCTSQSSCSSGYVCLSSRSCIPSALGGGCSCSGTASPGQCYAGTSCSNAGGSSPCCVGLQLINGKCSGATSQCPIQ